MKKIHRIVITGGHCAGKASAIAKVGTRLFENGYKFFVVSEISTENSNNGNWFTDITYNEATLQTGEKVVIIYDKDEIDSTDVHLEHNIDGHICFERYDNSTDLNEKISSVEKEVLAIIGLPVPTGCEKLYYIEQPNIQELRHVAKIFESHSVQTLLHPYKPGFERWVKKSVQNGNDAYFYIEKRTVANGKRVNSERLISKYKYQEFLIKRSDRVTPIKKSKYCFIWNNMYFEIDLYRVWDRCPMKITLTEGQTPQDINLPEPIKVAREFMERQAQSN